MDIPPEDVLVKLKRPSLQTYAKKFGIKANCSNTAIIEQLLALKNDITGNVDPPQAERAAPRPKSKRNAPGGHDADANGGNETRASKKSRPDKELRAQAPSETILNANPPELDVELATGRTPDIAVGRASGRIVELSDFAGADDGKDALRMAAKNEAQFMARTALNPSAQGDGEAIVPRPIRNGIARLNQATGRRAVAQTAQSGSSTRGRRVVRRPLRGQATLAHIPVQEDVMEAIEGAELDEMQSASNGKQRTTEDDDHASLRARSIPSRTEEVEGVDRRQHNLRPNVESAQLTNGNQGEREMLVLRRMDENGQLVGPLIMIERPPVAQAVTINQGGEVLMLRPEDIPQQYQQQAHPQYTAPSARQHDDYSSQPRVGAQMQLAPERVLEDQPTDIVEDPDEPMARNHSARLLFDKIDALWGGLVAADDGESGIPNLMTLRDQQPRIAQLLQRVVSLGVRVRAEQWRFKRVQTYVDYWNPDSGRTCTSRAVVRSTDAEDHQEEDSGVLEYVGPVSDEELWGDAAEANKLSGLMDEQYGLIRKRRM